MYCPHCGTANDDNNFRCTRCAQVIQPLPPPVIVQPASETLRWIVPIGRSWWAIAAGYAGLFALLVVPAPLALGLALVALRDLQLHPEKGGRGRAWFALVTGAIGTMALVAILLTRS